MTGSGLAKGSGRRRPGRHLRLADAMTALILIALIFAPALLPPNLRRTSIIPISAQSTRNTENSPRKLTAKRRAKYR